MAAPSSLQHSSSDDTRTRFGSIATGEEKFDEKAGDEFEDDGPFYAPIGGTRRTPSRSASQAEDYFSMYPDAAASIRAIATRTQTYTGRLSREPSRADGSQIERQDTLAGVNVDDPVLDPSKPEFDVYKWARMFTKLAKEEGMTEKQLGFTFKNLNVSGAGKELQLQKDVSDALMLPFRLGEYLSLGKGTEKKILRDFEGHVGAGEMLIVLGRPGSGCSTFLKSICGETHGLKVIEGSEITYSGKCNAFSVTRRH